MVALQVMSQDVTLGFPFFQCPMGTEDSDAHLTGWGPKGISPNSKVPYEDTGAGSHRMRKNIWLRRGFPCLE